MRAIVLDSYADTPHIAERPAPVAAPASVLVKVRATSVNPVDWKQATGKIKLFMAAKFPFVPGYDLAGEVVEVGPGATGFAVGDPVHTRLNGTTAGANAELAVCGLDGVRPMPAGMDFGEAAALPLAGMTALQGLRDVLGLPMTGASGRVLIVGASGGVGHFAVQLARSMGAHVVGVCSGKNAELVLGLGAHEVVDYTRADAYTNQAPFDFIYDCVGGDLGLLVSLLTPKGRYASCMPGPAIFLWPILHVFSGRSVKPVMLKSTAADLAVLDGLVDQGKLRVVIDSRFPLAELPAAWARSQSGRTVGKIVIDV
ncbi:quinone oxidoreductase [Deltaproteobacteria bacterium]|nr:quinone oxidoreductase [Deltaproteobacteria bacterium]